MHCLGVQDTRVLEPWCREPFPPGSWSRELVDTGQHQCFGLREKHSGPGLVTSDGERGAARPRTPCSVARPSFPVRGGPGSGWGPAWQDQPGRSHSSSSEDMQEAAPQKSELSRPDCSPALRGRQCRAVHSPPNPDPQSTCTSSTWLPGRPPEACLGVQVSEVSQLDLRCREVAGMVQPLALWHIWNTSLCEGQGPAFAAAPRGSVLRQLWHPSSRAQHPLRGEPASLPCRNGKSPREQGRGGRGGSWQ